MKKITMSLAATAILASGSYALDTAAGTLSGEVSAYTTSSSEMETGYTMGSVSVNFDTKDMNGFKASLGVMANGKLAEENDGDYDGGESEDAVLNVANVSYANEAFTLIAGRQAIDLEWISDYHEAVVGVVTAVPNLTLIAGYTQAFNANANDEALADFVDIGEDGAMVVDASYKAGDVTVGAYYMDAKDIFSAYGAKVEASVADLGITAKYAATSEYVTGTDDGNIMSLDLSYSMEPMTFGSGYIQTDKDGWTGSITSIGENINPLDSGNQVYGTDATTLYASVGASVSGFDLGALYGTTEYGDYTETELDLTVAWDCKLVKDLSFSGLYTIITADEDDVATADDKYYGFQAVYSF